jgi:hypothetical protein
MDAKAWPPCCRPDDKLRTPWIHRRPASRAATWGEFVIVRPVTAGAGTDTSLPDGTWRNSTFGVVGFREWPQIQGMDQARSWIRPRLDAGRLATLAALALALEIVGLRTLATRSGFHGGGLTLVAAIDLTFLGAVAYLCVIRPRGGLALFGFELRHAVQALLLACTLAGLLGKLAGIDMGALWAVAPAGMELGVLALFAHWGLRVRRARVNGQAAPALQELEGTLSLVLPAGLAAVLTTELRILGAALASLSLRPLRSRAGFSALSESQYPKIAVALLFLTLLEAPAVHLGIHAFHLRHAFWVHGVFLALHVYSWLWILGDLRLLRGSAHALTDAGLALELGVRAQALVPYAAIADVEVGAVTVRADDARITPMDAPNVRLTLSRPVRVRRLFRAEREVLGIALFVSDAAAFERELVNARASQLG